MTHQKRDGWSGGGEELGVGGWGGGPNLGWNHQTGTWRNSDAPVCPRLSTFVDNRAADISVEG